MKASLKLLCIVALLGVAGCVSQTTVENKPPDKPSMSDPLHRAKVRTDLSAAYYQRGALSVALEEARQALQSLPTHAPAHLMLGLIYMEMREDAKAVAAFEESLRLSPNNSETLNSYGTFICLRGEPRRAMPYFEAALKNPLYTSPQSAYLNAGTCAHRSKDDVEAERNLGLALQIQPALPQALYLMADISYRRGEFKDAGAFLARHARVQPNPEADVLLLGVRISRALNEGRNADSYLQQLRRRFPDAPQTRQATAGL